MNGDRREHKHRFMNKSNMLCTVGRAYYIFYTFAIQNEDFRSHLFIINFLKTA